MTKQIFKDYLNQLNANETEHTNRKKNTDAQRTTPIFDSPTKKIWGEKTAKNIQSEPFNWKNACNIEINLI